MAREHPIGRALFFCVKFLVFLAVIMYGWLQLMPYYGWLLMQLTGGILMNLFGVPIEPGRKVEASGFLNFTSTFTLVMHGGHMPASNFTQVAANLAPFLALVLATGKLRFVRRVLILLGGSLFLLCCHVGMMTYIFYQAHRAFTTGAMDNYAADIGQVAVQFMVMLPFLLWLVLAYWEKLAVYLGDGTTPREDPAKGQ